MKETIRLLRHNDQIVFLVNGQLTTSFGPEVAKVVARELVSLARQIENDANPERQIMDQAILMRAGINIGLNSNPKLLSEAHKEAQWNRDLRLAMKGAPGIPSNEVVGTPTVIRGKRHES
ncbi:hypothetical protein HBA55_29640 [Pseudomaricurvus alkylphenolicus]|uniref:hypothetical protein n=1 Tax=Pseudomaricurvus alkylphenolicus TaxID=1306991 RepID=UPI00141F4924|nr:hypothetical protein [Pseudomaricurvus alkylphenolicus]NIB43802.1 hypothetical protein [Pseudomaricurvus alkylphenolicus]